jgi:hypothetical protein
LTSRLRYVLSEVLTTSCIRDILVLSPFSSTAFPSMP